MSTGLVAAYSFDHGTGTTVNDSSGNGNNGTITNATWSTSGKFGDALSFTGKLNSWVTVADSSSLDLTNGMTLEAWVDPTTLSSPDQGWDAVVSKEHQNSANDISYALYAANGTGTPPAGHILVGNNDHGAQGTSVIPLKTWTFLSATFNGTTLNTYVNGTLVGSATVKGNIVTTTDPLRIGGDWDSEMFTGLIDNMRIYNTALTQSQIQTDMTTPVSNSASSTAPVVVSKSPASSATGVAVSSPVAATFNEAVQASTISFTVKNSSGNSIAGNVAYNSSTEVVTFTPSAALAYNTSYTATISGVQSTSGVGMSGPVSWSFTTDRAAPVVTKESPATGSSGVGVTTPVTATFNEAVQSGTIAFTLKNGSNTIGTTFSYNSSTHAATWTPNAALAAGTKYTANVSGVMDMAGDPMSGSASWSFTTALPAPIVSGHGPATSATGVAVSAAMTATFNEAVQSGTIGWSIKNGTATVAATPVYNSSTNTVTMTPNSPLAYGTTYTVTISAATSSGGVPMASPFSWSFATDPAPPSVTKDSPSSGATGVAITAPVTATFNEAVQSGTIGFTLKNGSNTVATNFSYNSSTNTATWAPTTALANGTTYTATVSGALDSAGDPMSGPVTWSFTTVALPAPKVTSATPATGATGVGAATTLSATFNEAVQSGTIGFTLKNGPNSVATNLVYNSSTNTATWTPAAALAYSTTYTATITGAEHRRCRHELAV